MLKSFKVLVEKHPDAYVAYPLGIQGVVVGEGATYEEAVEDLKAVLKSHIEAFGANSLDVDPPILEAFICEAGISA